MATAKEVLRGLQILSSYDNKFNVIVDEDKYKWVVAGPDHYNDKEFTEYLHPNEASIMFSNGWILDRELGYWIIEVE